MAAASEALDRTTRGHLEWPRHIFWASTTAPWFSNPSCAGNFDPPFRNGHASIHKALHTSTFNKKEQTCLANISIFTFFFLPSFWLFTSFPWHLFLLRTLSLDISFSWELFPFTSLSPDMISSHVFLLLLLFSSFDVDCIFSMSMFYSCHHSWSFPFLSIFSLTFCRPVAVCVPAKNTQALKSWEQDSKTISKYDEIWMCPKMGLPLFIIHFNKIFHFQHPFGGTPISGKPYI